ncbi:hypothetical protein NPIL_383201 [Nephila pilipes]|uniref:Uncharacterized protein n=1 Tax=Nephila pilipes TaxID=299642 RepID=A0A8X6NX15_NEPPI|nr:hypothetical protein NPIL_383201 [Nephila pilipes]
MRHFLNNTQPLQVLLKDRKQLSGALDALTDNLTRTKLQKINAEIKLTYAQIKRDKWNELCTILAPRVLNTKNYGMHELDAVFHDIDLRKSPGLDQIHGCMIDHLDWNARRRLLDIINFSWSSGHLPRDWKRATLIPI